MKAIQYIPVAFSFMAMLFLVNGCSPAGGENTGHEYMPDMGHSVAYEANVVNYYRYNTWEGEEELKKMAMPRKPVEGTVPRGLASVALANSSSERQAAMQRLGNEKFSLAVNGSVPYYYTDTEEERLRASAEITSNPFPPTKSALASGKTLYEVNCGICHGSKGAVNDGIAANDGPYPAAPANLMDEKFVAATDGQYYHAIMYGKNVMGGYSDKLSYEERWQVIHYIRSLQTEANGGTYALVDEAAAANSFVDNTETHAGDHADEGDLEAEFTALMESVKKGGSDAPASITLKNVVFNSGSDKLKGDSEMELMKLVKLLEGNTGLKVEIGGHTDNKGKGNLKLSEKRAKAVKKFLVGNGIAEGQLTAVGYGDTQPVADNETSEGRAKNRRTEFKIVH